MLLGFAIAFYVFVVIKYHEGFTYGTWINDVYCTGKTIGEVNSELVSRHETGIIKVSSDYYEDEFIDLNDIDFKIDYFNSLKHIYDNQNPYLWFLNLNDVYVNKYFQPEISYDHDKLTEAVMNLGLIKKYSPDNDYVIKIIYGDNGYELINTLDVSLDINATLALLESKVITEENVEVPKDLFYYRDITPKEKEVLALWDDLSSFLETKIIYDMGNENIPVDAKVLSSFIILANGYPQKSEYGFLINEDLVKQFVDKLCESYFTYKQPRDYVTHDGVTKHINMSVYGTEIDKLYEENYLVNAIKEGLTEKHIPKYLHVGYARGLDDIGKEFIEVDLTNQKLYYVKNGVVLMDTDIVSGYPNADNATPEMLCYVYKKKEKAILVGENYRSPVDYWMAIYKAIGLHDAKWQAKFGGDRYKRYGSHGCINMITKDAASLYEQIEVGIPVIVYK